jgi:putative transposase
MYRKNKNVDNHAYKFRCYPDDEQVVLLAKTFGSVRWIYNHLLEDKNTYYKETGQNLKKEVSEYKPFYEWLKEVDSLALANAKVNLDTAFKNFFEGKAKFPKFHKKGHDDKYTTNCVNGNIEIVDGMIKLPKLGFVKIKQHRVIGKNEIIKSVTVSKKGGKYFLSVLTECEKQNIEQIEKSTIPDSKILGIDFSVPHFYVDSNGNITEYPKYYRQMERKLAIEQHKLSKKVYRSKNYYKQLEKVQKIQAKIANQRLDFLHKLSCQLVNTYDVICFEDLNLNNLKQTLNFGKSISDEGFGMFRVLVKYKLERIGKYYILVDKWFASTKLCSVCNNKNDKITLATQKWDCPHCGAHHNRDYNAAINIQREGKRLLLA